MYRIESDFHYSKGNICCKWYESKPVILLATNVDGISWLSNVMKRTKGSATKVSVSCTNTMKFYNNGMCGVDIMDQNTAACRLDCKIK